MPELKLRRTGNSLSTSWPKKALARMNAKEGDTLYAVETPHGFLVGQQSTVAASTQAGGNWLYGGPNAEIGMVAAGVVRDAGYNLATGVAEISLRLKR